MEVDKYTQIEPLAQNYESEEGGLNLAGFKDKILRQIHVVLGITIAISSLAFLKAINRTPTYQADFEILSEPVTIETKVTSSGAQSRETREEVTAVTLNEVQLKTLKSPRIIASAVEELENKYPGINYGSIINTLSLTANTEGTILEVLYKHSDPEQVEDVLQALTIAYLDYSLQRRQSGINRGLEFLNQQIPKIQATVDELNQQLQQLRTKHNFIEPKIQGTQISARIDNLIVKQIEQKSQLKEAQRLANLATTELDRQSATSTTAMEIGTNRYNQLLTDLKQVDHQIAQKSAIFSPQSFEIQTLQEQRQAVIALIDRERTTIQQKINNQIELRQEQFDTVSKEITTMQQELQEWSGVTREYETIERQMTVTVEQLNELLIQREALRLEAAQKEAPWRLLTPVREARSDAASKINYVILGSFLGLLVGTGAALIIDQYQNLVYNSHEVKEITNQPVLGIIPFDSSNFNHSDKKLPFQKIINLVQPSEKEQKSSQIQLYQESSPLSNLSTPSIEAFRFLGANLSLFEVKQQKYIRSLIVTSAISGEGKSTVVINLAQAKAVMGTRVLVVEADMRSPTRLSSSMMSKPHYGLSDFLSCDDISIKQIIKKSCLEKNLFIISSGSISHNEDTSKLLASPKMRILMERLKQYFELVIYDVASVVDYADVSLLASKTDGVMFVTGLGKLQALKLKEAMDQLNISRIPVLGVVINKVTANI
ncbi:conserved hypothetical protein [Hyella patelloides LEGE 07179]|uniref:CobQ/CobB/MinD/ParA nucleotide binding domain-containing protein n=1 Tax=Hyella patelloides LEGE 07179 TaxID=945734 RepID=A0A563VMN0_9CYAN|nr:polysaccharide biosynthesis tyrosine autokinase [Hyella patelloides]VEP12672.1 conserved hypothetical protein [Hyella patelloides LEGE 07179]